MTLSFTEQNEKRFTDVLTRYPADHKKAALLPALWIAQGQWGHLTDEIMTYVAERLDLQPSEVMSTATFYTMFYKKPVGKHHVQVCTNLSCWLRGSDKLMAHLEARLGIQCGETTEDGQFTLDHVECLASCGTAPMMQVDDKYYEDLTAAKVDELLGKWRKDG